MIYDMPIKDGHIPDGPIFDARIFLGESFDGTSQDVSQALRGMESEPSQYSEQDIRETFA